MAHRGDGLWGRDDLDLVCSAFIEFSRDGTGRFAFVAVEASTDWRDSPREDRPGVEFSWEGNDEGDLVSGRGWAKLDSGVLQGRIYFHLGDDSGFHATRSDVWPVEPSSRFGSSRDNAGIGTTLIVVPLSA